MREELGGSDDSPWTEQDFFDSVDVALEMCEEQLIADGATPADAAGAILPLEEMDITDGLDPAEMQILAALIKTQKYAHGDTIIYEGAHPDELFMLAAGRASIGVRVAANRPRKRVGAISAGVTFGELALFDGGPRTADITADTDAVCYVLPVSLLRDSAGTHPSLMIKLLRNVGRGLANRFAAGERGNPRPRVMPGGQWLSFSELQIPGQNCRSQYEPLILRQQD